MLKLLRKGINATVIHKRWLQSHCLARRAPAPTPLKVVRTRFAPSPTGLLHLGSLRTALFNYLVARKYGGQFILRIEDTDQARLTKGAEDAILSDLKWCGLNWDEGPDIGGSYGSYRQSDRKDIYQIHAQQLVDREAAYRCFCSETRLSQMAQLSRAMGKQPEYDRRCTALPRSDSDRRAYSGESHVIRLKMPDSLPDFNDLTYGIISARGKSSNVMTSSHEDPILLKSDGLPTYHLANVVDDHLMDITHVIRANEWISSTFKHQFLYDAFGWEAPVYAHLGLVQDEDQRKLSKRRNSKDIGSFREKGILPEALINYCVLLGWSHISKDDLMDMAYLIENFDMKFTRNNSKIDLSKLDYLQARHAKAGIDVLDTRYEHMCSSVLKALERRFGVDAQIDDRMSQVVRKLLKTQITHYSYPAEFVERYLDVFFLRPRAATVSTRAGYLTALRLVLRPLNLITDANWQERILRETLGLIMEKDVRQDGLPSANSIAQATRNRLYTALRWAIVGGRKGASVCDLMYVLGKTESMRRIHDAIEHLELPDHGNK